MERVDRPTIKAEVIAKLTATVEPANDITEGMDLADDLGMAGLYRRAMAMPYSKIATRYGGKPVKLQEAQDLVTVKESIDLVHKRANA
jgi:hypothetical protein